MCGQLEMHLGAVYIKVEGGTGPGWGPTLLTSQLYTVGLGGCL